MYTHDTNCIPETDFIQKFSTYMSLLKAYLEMGRSIQTPLKPVCGQILAQLSCCARKWAFKYIWTENYG